MAKRITAYVLSALSAPLTLAGLHVIVLSVFGPHYFFQQGELWDWTDFAADALGFVVFSGVLPALVFFAPVAWLISRRSMKLSQAMITGAVGGLAFCLYAAANGDWPFLYDWPGRGGFVNQPLFYFFGAAYGDLLALRYDAQPVATFFHALVPVLTGMLTAAFFQTLIKPEAERG